MQQELKPYTEAFSSTSNTASPASGDGLSDTPVLATPDTLEKVEHAIPADGEKSNEQPSMPPEAGLAGWLCVLGSTIGIFCTFGFLAA